MGTQKVFLKEKSKKHVMRFSDVSKRKIICFSQGLFTGNMISVFSFVSILSSSHWSNGSSQAI